MDKCIIFCRVSTDRQNLDEQELKASALAESDGYSPEQQILISYKESAIRLSEEARIGLTDMKESITQDASIKAVYAYEISRIARSQKVLYSVRDFLLEHHVQLCIVSPPIRLLQPNGTIDQGAELAFSLYATMAEQEMRQKRERFKSGKERNKRLGKFNGGNVPFGFLLTKQGVLEVDSSRAGTVQSIYGKYLEGWSLVRIRDWLKSIGHVMTTMGIKSILDNNRNVSIVGEEVWNSAHAERSARKSKGGEDRHRRYSICERLIRCPVCGHYYQMRTSKYVCCYHDSQYINTEKYCKNSASLVSRRMDAIVVTMARQWYANRCAMDEEMRVKELDKRLAELPAKISTLSDSLSNIVIRKQRIAENYEEGLLTKEKRDARLAKVRADETRIRNELAVLQSELERTTARKSQPIMTALDALEHVDSLNQQDLYTLVHEQVKEVILTLTDEGKQIEVRSFFHEKAVFLFTGQARAFHLYRIYDGEKIDITEVETFR